MELKHLRYFVVAAEEENFHRAAERLHVAQPALSRRIRDLETELGFDLFARNRNRICLSAAGRAYLQHVKGVLVDLDAAGALGMRVAKGQAGTLTLGTPECLLHFAGVVRAFREFRADNPRVELRLKPLPPAQVCEALLHGNVDAAFAFDCLPDSARLDSCLVGIETWMLALPRNHELAEHKQISLRDLKAVPFIWSRCQTVAATSDGLIGACRAAGFTPSIAHHVDSECTKTCLVAAGEGVGFVLSGACTPVDNVAFREVQDLAVEVRLNLVWRKQQLTMQLRRFLEIVKRVGAARRQEASRRPHPGAACP